MTNKLTSQDSFHYTTLHFFTFVWHHKLFALFLSFGRWIKIRPHFFVSHQVSEIHVYDSLEKMWQKMQKRAFVPEIWIQTYIFIIDHLQMSMLRLNKMLSEILVVISLDITIFNDSLEAYIVHLFGLFNWMTVFLALASGTKKKQICSVTRC